MGRIAHVINNKIDRILPVECEFAKGITYVDLDENPIPKNMREPVWENGLWKESLSEKEANERDRFFLVHIKEELLNKVDTIYTQKIYEKVPNHVQINMAISPEIYTEEEISFNKSFILSLRSEAKILKDAIRNATTIAELNNIKIQ